MIIALRESSEKLSPLPSRRPARFSSVGTCGVFWGGVATRSGGLMTGSQNAGGRA
jgi:hypothetical protein